MRKIVKIRDKQAGPGEPVYIVAEIGLNHNGDLNIAKKLVDVAVAAGCDAVKFQKRTPELCVPPEYRKVNRETPWGIMTYMEYRERVEFGKKEYEEIDRYCREKGIEWFVSVWDEESVNFIRQFDTPCLKIPSAAVTDIELLKHISKQQQYAIVLSTGMSTMQQIRSAVKILESDNMIITHCTSTYPCEPEELNLRMIPVLQKEFQCPVGYSGHEVGLQTTYAAAVFGACYIERHITLSRAMWGSDQGASIEPRGLIRLVRDIRTIERAYGDGVKKIYDSEKKIAERLRWKNKQT